jgi:hypothetical protein
MLIRRACQDLAVDTSTCHYKSCRCYQADLEPASRTSRKYKCGKGVAVCIVLQREDRMTNIKRAFSLYTLFGL